MNPQNTKRAVKVLKTTVSQKTRLGTSYGAIPGGTILYTPPTGVSNVIYQFTSHIAYVSAPHSDATFRLLYGDSLDSLTSIATDDSNYLIDYGENGAGNNYDVRDERQINLTYLVPAYAGTKYLVLEGKSESTGNRYAVNCSDDWNSVLFDPFIIVYSI